jgi:glycosyltransferase 2 family protein
VPADEAPLPRPSWWNHPLIKVALFVSLVLGLWWLLAGIDFAKAWAILRRAHPVPIVLAAAANLLSQVTRALGWAVLLAGHRIPFRRLVRYELMAQGASAVSPEGSGELIRLAQLGKEGVPASTTLSVIAARKLLSSAGLVPLLALLPWAPPGAIPHWGGAVVAVYVLAMAALLVTLLAVARRPRRTRDGRPSLRDIADRLHAGVAPLRRGRTMTASLASAVLTRLLDVAAALMILAGLGMPVSPPLAVFSLLLVEVSNVLPTAPGQLGSFDAAVLTAAAGFVPGEQAVAFALLLHAQQIVPQAVAGAVVVAAGTVGRRDTRATPGGPRHG